MRAEHFKMKGLHLIPDLIQAGDWMINLKDAYVPPGPHSPRSSKIPGVWLDC